MALKLVIGNKNYSSWSMRPWLALRASHVPFEEIFIPLYTGQTDKDRILRFTRSGKVPALIDGDITVWDSLSIMHMTGTRTWFRIRHLPFGTRSQPAVKARAERWTCLAC